MSNKIAVIGSGGWGTAAAIHLSKLGHDVTLWSWLEDESNRLKTDLENKEFLPGIKIPSEINFTSDITCAMGKDIIVLVTPSKAIRSTANALSKHVSKGALVVILSKGIEEKSLKTLSEVVTEEIPHAHICVMSGPSHAEEVARGIVLNDYDSFNYFQKTLKEKGIIKELKARGAQDGDIVRILDFEFEFVE